MCRRISGPRRTSLHVYRVFHPEAEPPSAADGLDLSAFAGYRADAREAAPFAGPAAARINAGESFFRDAVRSVREGSVVVPHPSGRGAVASSDILVGPSVEWTSVPLYVCRFATPEGFVLVKRGLSWCTDLGLLFPARDLFVSFQAEDRRMAQDLADVDRVARWLHALEGTSRARGVVATPSDAATVLVTSNHFAHHVWNELSVLDGLVTEGLHDRLRLLVHHQPVAPLADLFPEIAPRQIAVVGGSLEEPTPRERPRFVVPAGRRHVPSGLVERVLRVARAAHPHAATEAAAFHACHDLVLWVTLRLDARTATNLVDALAHAVDALRARVPSLGLVVDGFTTPAGADEAWNRAIIAAEHVAAEALVARAGAAAHVVLIGRPTTEAFIWATAADYYVCPYGSAHHKVAWMHLVPGLVHAGENKRATAHTDPGLYARQQGPVPAFAFAPVTRRDVAPDTRQDLFSYALDPHALTAALLADLDARVPRYSAALARR